jgi:hypothetical protein
MFEILENQKILENDARLILIPEKSPFLVDLLAGSDLQNQPAGKLPLPSRK